MNEKCKTCIDLWREYAVATHTHIDIESKLEIARLKHDPQAIQMLLIEAQAAADRRTQYRRELSDHDRAAHSSENESKSGKGPLDNAASA